MVADWLSLQLYRARGRAEPDKLRGDDAALVDQLVEGVLAIRSWLAEVDFLEESDRRDVHVINTVLC
jgi:hypothetical protein